MPEMALALPTGSEGEVEPGHPGRPALLGASAHPPLLPWLVAGAPGGACSKITELFTSPMTVLGTDQTALCTLWSSLRKPSPKLP